MIEQQRNSWSAESAQSQSNSNTELIRKECLTFAISALNGMAWGNLGEPDPVDKADDNSQTDMGVRSTTSNASLQGNSATVAGSQSFWLLRQISLLRRS